jgi:hypothetical protein
MAKSNAEKEALVLVAYAAAMKAVQEFEQQLKSVAVYRADLPDGISADVAWRRVEKILRSPLERLANSFPDDLRTHWTEIKQIRNHLAHEALVLWQLDRNLGLRSDEELVDSLVEYESSFLAWSEQLEPIAQEALREHGIRPEDCEFSRQDMRRMILNDYDSD